MFTFTSGIHEVGIYRVSGVSSDVKRLKEKFDESKCNSYPYTNKLAHVTRLIVVYDRARYITTSFFEKFLVKFFVKCDKNLNHVSF